MENLIIDHILSFLSILISLLISLFAFNGVIKSKPFTSFLVVASIFGFIISSCVSFDLNLGRYFIVGYYFFVFSCFLSKIYKKKFSLIYFLKHKIQFIKLFVLFGILSCLYLVYNLNIGFIYNAHDPYFYGIPFEIIEGNYSSRIKIWDNYPQVWAKYQFFNGSIYSIFLFFSGIKNIFLYKLIKISFIIVLFFSLKENLKIKPKLFYNLLVFTLPITIWLFYTNGDFSVVFLIIAIFLYLDKKLGFSLLFILFFSSSLARHVLPGILMFLFILYNHRKTIFKSKIVLLYIFPIVNIISMILTGNQSSTGAQGIQDLNFYLDGKFFLNFFYGGWTENLLQNTPSLLFKKLFNVVKLKEINIFDLNILIYFISAFLLSLLIFKLKDKKIKALTVVVTLSTLILIIFRKFFPSLGNIFNIINAFFVFSFPIFIIIRYRNKQNAILFQSFMILYVSSLISIITFGVDVGLPIFFLVNIIVAYLLLEDSNINFIDFKLSWFLILLVSFVLYPKFDDTSHIFDMKNVEIKNPESELQFYKNKYDTIGPILNSNIYGKRIKFSKESSHKFHVSKRFISPVVKSDLKKNKAQ